MERPIIFNDAMVRAIHSGAKTETRRPRKPQHPDVYVGPYGEEGDTLWIRECFGTAINGDGLIYRADYYRDILSLLRDQGHKWTPSIHMPRKASRTVLDVLEVRVERLQSMSEEDARAEGFETRAAFCGTWDAIYPTMGMRHNPWVWVVRFKRQGGV